MVLQDRSGSDDSMGVWGTPAINAPGKTRKSIDQVIAAPPRQTFLFRKQVPATAAEEQGTRLKTATGPEVSPRMPDAPDQDGERAAQTRRPADERETRSVEQAIDDIEPANPLLGGPINPNRSLTWRRFSADAPFRLAGEFSSPAGGGISAHQYLSGDDPGVSRPGCVEPMVLEHLLPPILAHELRNKRVGGKRSTVRA